MAGAGCPLSLASCGTGAHPQAGAGCECPFGRWGAASGAEAMPKGAEGVGITPVRGRCPVASSAGRRVGAGVPQPQFPSCPRGGASSGEKPQCRTARCWVNTTAGAFVPPSPGGMGGHKNVLGKQCWSGAAPLPWGGCWGRGARLRAAPVSVLLRGSQLVQVGVPRDPFGRGQEVVGWEVWQQGRAGWELQTGLPGGAEVGCLGMEAGILAQDLCPPLCSVPGSPHIPPTPSLWICPPGVTEGETSLANTLRAICGAPLSLPPSQGCRVSSDACDHWEPHPSAWPGCPALGSGQDTWSRARAGAQSDPAPSGHPTQGAGPGASSHPSWGP